MPELAPNESPIRGANDAVRVRASGCGELRVDYIVIDNFHAGNPCIDAANSALAKNP